MPLQSQQRKHLQLGALFNLSVNYPTESDTENDIIRGYQLKGKLPLSQRCVVVYVRVNTTVHRRSVQYVRVNMTVHRGSVQYVTVNTTVHRGSYNT